MPVKKLSPAAQAILDSWNAKFNPEVIYLPRDSERNALANVLRAAADQVVPEELFYYGDHRWRFERDTRQRCRQHLLAIADELEAQ